MPVLRKRLIQLPLHYSSFVWGKNGDMMQQFLLGAGLPMTVCRKKEFLENLVGIRQVGQKRFSALWFSRQKLSKVKTPKSSPMLQPHRSLPLVCLSETTNFGKKINKVIELSKCFLSYEIAPCECH